MATLSQDGSTVSTVTTHTSNGSVGPYAINFPYTSALDLEVFVNGVLKTRTTHYTFSSTTQITFTSGNAPANGAIIKINRNTIMTGNAVFFEDASVLTAANLNANADQLLHGVQELIFDYVRRDGSQGVTGNHVFE